MTQIITLNSDLIERLSGGFRYDDADVSAEVRYLKQYELERTIDPYEVIAKNFLLDVFKEETNYEKITTFFNLQQFIHKVTVFVEKIDIILLHYVDNVDFKNIVFDSEKNGDYNFKVIPK